jgi:membrane protease YdiL (CAAX protease family)
MATFRAFITSHPVSAYFGLTFAISWGGTLVATAGSGMSATAGTSDPRFAYALVAMLLGPSVSGLLLTAIVDGRGGLRELLARMLKWRVATRWYAVALLAAPLLWGLALLVLSLVSPRLLPGVVTTSDRTTLVSIGLAVALSAGLFEEIGWTGFAIPRLLARHGTLATGVIVGVVWSAWHVLVSIVWAAPATAGELPVAVFITWSLLTNPIGYLTAFRVLMVWVYERTRSVFVAILMHISVTGSVLILDPAALTGRAALTYALVVAVTVWVAAAFAAIRSGRRRSQHRAIHRRLAA